MTLGPSLILLGLIDGAKAEARVESYSAGVWPSTAVLLWVAPLPPSHYGYRGCFRLLPTYLAWPRKRRLCSATFRIWSRSAFRLRHVGIGSGNSLPALSVVYETPISASELDLAKLSVRVRELSGSLL
jgi:hypothetical protein